MPRKKIVEETKSSPMQDLIDQDVILRALPKVGDIVKDKVITASKKEVLLDLNGAMTGLIRNKELYNEAEEFANLKAGDETEATVLELENEQGMLELSFRYAGHQRTWSSLQKLKAENQAVAAKVTDANKGGLLVMVNNVAGFLPVSQLSPEFYPRVQGGDKNKILEKLKGYVGQKFNVKVLDVDPDNEKLIVSEKAAWEENQKGVLDKYKIGDVVEGKITAVTDFGVFVEFGERLEGLVHISELAWQRIDSPSDLYKVGDAIKAEVIKLDGSKIFLSIKKLIADPWQNISEKYKVGDVVEGTVLKSTAFGLFVKLDSDIHGLAHVSELSDKKVDSAESIAKPGSVMKFKIVSIEPHEHRLGLSLKALNKGKEVASQSSQDSGAKEEISKEDAKKEETPV